VALAYCVLASGSSGNCLWVRGGGVAVLIDCGISTRQVGRRLASIGAELDEIVAVVCTHGHGDHVGGVAGLVRRRGVEVLATAPTLRAIPGRVPPQRMRVINRSGVEVIGGLSIRTTPTSHDAPGSVAVIVSDHDSTLGVLTDVGRATRTLVAALSEVDALAIEFNHDVDMLRAGPYPARLKRRILSHVGHLSNAQSAALLRRLLHPGLQHVSLLHLSQHNNTPTLAMAAAQSALLGHSAASAVTIGEPNRASPLIALRPNPPRQLALPW
jgi:phosphoribosyl 1,2-cyclic phosphodiesterase